MLTTRDQVNHKRLIASLIVPKLRGHYNNSTLFNTFLLPFEPANIYLFF